MSVILVDLGKNQNDLQINGWNWRPTLELIRRTGRFSDEQITLLGCNGCGATVSHQEALAIAQFIEVEVLPRLKDDEMIHRNDRISKQPHMPRLIAQTLPDELYAARKSWLESFVGFCKSCGGFKVV